MSEINHEHLQAAFNDAVREFRESLSDEDREVYDRMYEKQEGLEPDAKIYMDSKEAAVNERQNAFLKEKGLM